LRFAAKNGEKNQAPIRQNGSVILMGRYILASPKPLFERLTHGSICRNAGSSRKQETQKQMNTTKTLIAGAAVAGLMAGSLPVRAYAASAPNQAGVSLQTLADKGAHTCKGQNACKGQGGCKSGDNGCKGKNSCKGKGGCASKKS
jgi:hypothetical protein